MVVLDKKRFYYTNAPSNDTACQYYPNGFLQYVDIFQSHIVDRHKKMLKACQEQSPCPHYISM